MLWGSPSEDHGGCVPCQEGVLRPPRAVLGLADPPAPAAEHLGKLEQGHRKGRAGLGDGSPGSAGSSVILVLKCCIASSHFPAKNAFCTSAPPFCTVTNQWNGTFLIVSEHLL